MAAISHRTLYMLFTFPNLTHFHLLLTKPVQLSLFSQSSSFSIFLQFSYLFLDDIFPNVLCPFISWSSLEGFPFSSVFKYSSECCLLSFLICAQHIVFWYSLIYFLMPNFSFCISFKFHFCHHARVTFTFVWECVSKS